MRHDHPTAALSVAQTAGDPGWVLQRFVEPTRVADGQWLSVGLQSFEGVLGGIYLRTSPEVVVSARDAAFIPVTFP